MVRSTNEPLHILYIAVLNMQLLWNIKSKEAFRNYVGKFIPAKFP